MNNTQRYKLQPWITCPNSDP